MPEAAIVLATYNEAENLPILVERLQSLGESLHLVVVDDNSPDGTGDLAEELARRWGNITVIHRPAKLGLGTALREGLAAALKLETPCLMVMDADLSHDPQDVPRLLAAMRQRAPGVELIQGSRYAPGGGTRGWGWRRRLISRWANRLYRWSAGGPREYTTNFRVFTRRAAALVVERARSRGYELQPEIVLLLRAAGGGVQEVPIIFTDRMRGKSKLGIGQTIKGILAFGVAAAQYRLGLGRFARRPVAPDKALRG